MKRFFSLFAMLASVTASATITVTPLNTDYATKKVTFKVEWTNTPTAPYNNRVWVWIDFCPVSGTTPGGFAPATITGTTITSGSGSISGLTSRGFFIAGSATNSGTTVTATLSPVPAAKFNWCVYGSDYPPNVSYFKGTYTLKGTPDFVLTTNSIPQIIPVKSIINASVTVNAQSTFIDATGCPGIGAWTWTCPYTGDDLYVDPTHICRERTSGAQNWEAWIKDTRDNELYRIVYMPDKKWWLAQNVKLASYNSATVGNAISGCTKDECGRSYTWAEVYTSYAGGSSGSTGNVQGICPSGWLLPIRNTFTTLAASIGNASAACIALRPLNSACSPRNDTYGWASLIGIVNGVVAPIGTLFYTNDAGREDGFNLDHAYVCGGTDVNNDGDANDRAVVRCFRQL